MVSIVKGIHIRGEQVAEGRTLCLGFTVYRSLHRGPSNRDSREKLEAPFKYTEEELGILGRVDHGRGTEI